MASERKRDLPRNYEGVVNLITAAYPDLSAGHQQIARFFTQNPNVIALDSISTIAAQCDVHPSSLVRFAQHLGYAGFKELQAVFQTRLATAAPGFRERIGALDSELSSTAQHGNLAFLKNLVVRDIASLQGLLESVEEEMLAEAARLLATAQTVFIAGQLRSEPIASLLRYLLTMLRRKVVLLDPSGGLAQEMALTLSEGDVLVGVAFRHYSKEVVAICETAAQARIPIIAITDSPLSPLAKGGRVVFTIPEEEYSFSRSLAAPMCLVQCLATATAAVLQPNKSDTPRIPSVTEIARDDRARLPRPRKPPAR